VGGLMAGREIGIKASRFKKSKIQSFKFPRFCLESFETFEKDTPYVIPAKAGIQNHLKIPDSVSSTE
jgi:hypothetical protein